jgi:hypothetical protein
MPEMSQQELALEETRNREVASDLFSSLKNFGEAFDVESSVCAAVFY